MKIHSFYLPAIMVPKRPGKNERKFSSMPVMGHTGKESDLSMREVIGFRLLSDGQQVLSAQAEYIRYQSAKLTYSQRLLK